MLSYSFNKIIEMNKLCNTEIIWPYYTNIMPFYLGEIAEIEIEDS